MNTTINNNIMNNYQIWVGTQAEFDALSTKSDTIIYMITDQVVIKLKKIYIGKNKIKNIHIGNKNIKKIYIGNKQIYEGVV